MRFAVLLLLAARLPGAVHLPCIVSDHMVLLRDQAAPIWGAADAGEQVTVTLGASTATASAGPDGRWMVHLDLTQSGDRPGNLVIKGSNEIVISDVLVGETWLASGQSNMEHTLQATIDAEAEIARSANPLLRHFKVGKVLSAQPLDTCKGHWEIAGPETSGGFTAVGYYFGKRMQEKRQIPVGIINASWGGTFSELWISSEGMERDERLRAGDAVWRNMASDYPAKKQAFVEAYRDWLKTNHREDRTCPDPAHFAGAAFDRPSWSTVSLPGKVSAESATGAFWIRKDIDVPRSFLNTGQDFKIMLGPFEGFEQVYWNGKKVAETPYEKYPGQGYPRYFTIPKPLMHAGQNSIAVRIYAPSASPVLLVGRDAFNAGPINLAGDWLENAEYEFPRLTPIAAVSVPKPPVRPLDVMASSIFNGVVHPIVPYGIAGVLWYQGESDSGRAYEYRTALRLLIEDWREKWKDTKLPFYICQLPSFGPKAAAPGESEWAEVRESQAAVLNLPRTAMAVLIDLGESKDVHLRDKKDIGERLASLVLDGKSGPVYGSMQVQGRTVRVRFSHSEGLRAKALPATYDVSTLLGQTAPLVRNSPQSELEGFQICGEDRHWYWADARVEGDSVMVSSPQVAQPVAVRYAWSDNPTVNLVNSLGLPAVPFRTDDFPAKTLNNHFGPGK